MCGNFNTTEHKAERIAREVVEKIIFPQQFGREPDRFGDKEMVKRLTEAAQPIILNVLEELERSNYPEPGEGFELPRRPIGERSPEMCQPPLDM